MSFSGTAPLSRVGPDDDGRAAEASADGRTRLVVIQPSSFCNIDCRYCYVPDRADRTTIDAMVLQDILTKVFRASCVIDGFRLLWHNGEPLALGIPFYARALEIIDRVNEHHKPYYNCIQTNATLIDRTWAEFFLEHDISPSVSIDGPQPLHDANRVTRSGRGTFQAAMRGVRVLREHGIGLAGLCVVTANTLDHGRELMDFFAAEGFTRLGFIIEEPWGASGSTSFTQLSSARARRDLEERYRVFISELFDAWYPRRHEIHVREFVDMLSAFRKLRSNDEAFARSEDGSGCVVLSFDRQGGITTFSPQMIAGSAGDRGRFIVANIRDVESLDDVHRIAAHVALDEEIRAGRMRCRTECGYYQLCGGGSPAAKFYEHGTFDCTETRECRWAKKILSEVLLDKVSSMKEVISSGDAAQGG